MRSITKELFIMALLIMIVIFMIGMFFYEYMPNNKTVPEPVTYVADASTTAVLDEIVSAAESEAIEYEAQSIIKSYSVGAKELSTAAARQSYNSGKTDPFAEYSELVGVDGSAGGNTSANAVNGTTNQNSSSTGTFFENKSSK